MGCWDFHIVLLPIFPHNNTPLSWMYGAYLDKLVILIKCNLDWIELSFKLA
jgi:hypothetical protein